MTFKYKVGDLVQYNNNELKLIININKNSFYVLYGFQTKRKVNYYIDYVDSYYKLIS
jgi:ABC-type bacteriocin/lantibiotic exporter with double-glycine peptidase domain